MSDNVIDLNDYRISKVWPEAAIKAADPDPHGHPDPIAVAIQIARQTMAKNGVPQEVLDWAGNDFQRVLAVVTAPDYRELVR